jgi:hypothetical protein
MHLKIFSGFCTGHNLSYSLFLKRPLNTVSRETVSLTPGRQAISNCTIPHINVSLPQGWIQEIKCMLLVHLMHSLFLT